MFILINNSSIKTFVLLITSLKYKTNNMINYIQLYLITLMCGGRLVLHHLQGTYIL